MPIGFADIEPIVIEYKKKGKEFSAKDLRLDIIKRHGQPGEGERKLGQTVDQYIRQNAERLGIRLMTTNLKRGRKFGFGPPSEEMERFVIAETLKAKPGTKRIVKVVILVEDGEALEVIPDTDLKLHRIKTQRQEIGDSN